MDQERVAARVVVSTQRQRVLTMLALATRECKFCVRPDDTGAAAKVEPKVRRKSKPSKAAKARRVDSKKGRGQVKAGRAKVAFD